MHPSPENTNIPYLELGKALLRCIFDALKAVIDADLDKDEEEKDVWDILNLNEEKRKAVKDAFSPFYKKVVAQQHNEAILHLSQDNERLPKILLTAYEHVREDSKRSKGVCIPSPLNILHQMLTVPSEPQSAAYVSLFCRSLLYETFRVFPKHLSAPEGYEQFEFSQVSSCLAAFVRYAKNHENIPEADSMQSMLAHYLALKGIFYLRFDNRDDAYSYLRSREISTLNGGDKVKIKFHRFTYYSEAPDASTLVNELIGIPIPLKGIDAIFQGGLKTNSKSNLVMRVSGQAGSGKTSFALALAAAMSPFGTYSCYISLEEEEEDLTNRLYSLIPEYLKNLFGVDKNIASWFGANVISFGNSNAENPSEKFDAFIKGYLDRIHETLQAKYSRQQNDLLPAVCPLMIVVDSIRPFKGLDFEKFIAKCKRLQALIILISPNDDQYHSDIDYLVDVVINLKHIGTETQEAKPTRILQLLKTRYQVARHGAHVFHMSAKDGIHISPQLPSQIDKKEIVTKLTPSSTYYTDFFNECAGKPLTDSRLPDLQVWDKSQILLHGYGSTGKAGLALTILLYPFKKRRNPSAPSMDKDVTSRKRRALVISLLYPEEYYSSMEKKIKDRYEKISRDAKTDCICFYAGYLSPEDFINKILQKLDEAILEGEPFTGILLDGLHNATLQFPKLQKSDMVWSTLYSLLAKYHLTIVTTFTNFIIDDEKSKKNEDRALLKGGELLLDIMFQAADYSFSIRKPDKVDDGRFKIKAGQFIVTLKSAIRYRIGVNDKNFLWDREDLLLEELRKKKIEDSSAGLFS
jgi:hypothetical protein